MNRGAGLDKNAQGTLTLDGFQMLQRTLESHTGIRSVCLYMNVFLRPGLRRARTVIEAIMTKSTRSLRTLNIQFCGFDDPEDPDRLKLQKIAKERKMHLEI